MRAGTSGLIQLGGAFDYNGLRDLLMRGIPGGPPPVPASEIPEEVDFDEDEDEVDFDEDDEVDLDSEVDYGAESESSEEDLGDPDAMYRATPKGSDMVAVVFALRHWLETRPGGPHPNPSSDPDSGPPMISLICGWSSTVIHALAMEPLSVAELTRTVEIADRATVKEVLEGMVRFALAEALPGQGETRYTLTEWGRSGIAPLIASTRYERLYPAAFSLPPDVLDVEAAFRMALPLLALPAGLRGRSRLGVWIPGGEPTMAGATVEVEGGRVASSTPLLDESPDTWVTGLPVHWCEAIMDPSVVEKLASDGDEELNGALLQALHERLFGEAEAARA